MFGYFRPFEAMSHSAHKRAFCSHYCRLCYCLRSIGGQKARAFTTFDAAIYGMIYCIATKQPSPPYLPCEKVRRTNMRKFTSDEFGMRLARISLVAFGEKLRDDELDGERSLKLSFVRSLYGRMIRNAEKEESAVTENSRKGTDAVNELQKSGADIHEVLGAYGNSVASTFLCIGDIGKDAYDLICAIAEWTFFVDMLCDYDEDMKEGKPNSLHKADCKTLREYFDKNYIFVMKEERLLVDRIMTPLMAIDDGSDDWQALYTIITHALDTVICELLSGESVEFKYFKELTKNFKELHRQNKQRSKENKRK